MKNIPKILSLIFLLIIGYFFWFTSRYPQLSEKKLSGANTPLPDLLSFDTIVSHSDEYLFIVNIFISFINWCFTNYKGMIFGLLFAVGILTLLYFYKIERYSKNRFMQGFIGMIQGFGLGVCVNCVTPIGKSLLKAGAPKVSTISTMVSSPSFNVISFSLIFALFPWYIAAGKILFSLYIIIIVIPLIFYEDQPNSIQANGTDSYSSEASMKGYVVLFLKVFLKNFLFIIKTTVPLMLLGGFLGVFIVSFISLDALNGARIGIDTLLLTATIGFLLPVPIFFDIIFSSILFSTNIPSIFSIILLLTLGGFSIYPLMILSFEINKKKLLLFSVIFISSSVIFSYVMYSYKIYSDTVYINNFLELSPAAEPEKNKYAQIFKSDKNIKEEIPTSPEIKWSEVFTQKNIRVLESDYIDTNQSAGKFVAMNPSEIGLQKKGKNIFNGSFTSTAAMDFDNDGWQDLFIATQNGVQIYKNIGGGFEMVDFDFPESIKNDSISNIIAHDLDGDTLKDLFISTKGKKIYIFWNNGESYSKNDMVVIEDTGGTEDILGTKIRLESGISFGDIFNDGNIDIFIGNFSIFDPSANTNYIIKNLGNRVLQKIDYKNEVVGPTTISMIHDFDGDNKQEIYVGNDFGPSDVFYDVENNKISLHESSKDIFPVAPAATMNFSIGDTNNDGIPEYYLSGIYPYENDTRLFGKDILDEYSSCSFPQNNVENSVKETCNIVESLSYAIYHNKCELLQEDVFLYNRCVEVNLIIRLGTLEKELIDNKLCKKLENSYYAQGYSYYCTDHFPVEMMKGKKIVIPSKQGNTFLQKNNTTNKYEDVSGKIGVENTGWAWGGFFRDLDQNGWQDLYITNGHIGFQTTPISNIFFENNNGVLINQTQKIGLINNLDTIGAIAFDYDNDGDLDVLNNTFYGDLVFFKNEIDNNNNSIYIELIDRTSKNTGGLGSKIIITDNDDNKQIRFLYRGGSYMSYSPLIAHFGLGKMSIVKQIEIIWSNGESEILKNNFNVNKKYKIIRGK